MLLEEANSRCQAVLAEHVDPASSLHKVTLELTRCQALLTAEQDQSSKKDQELVALRHEHEAKQRASDNAIAAVRLDAVRLTCALI
jgi:hypothetical protein